MPQPRRTPQPKKDPPPLDVEVVSLIRIIGHGCYSRQELNLVIEERAIDVKQVGGGTENVRRKVVTAYTEDDGEREHQFSFTLEQLEYAVTLLRTEYEARHA